MEKVAIIGNADYSKMLYRYIQCDGCFDVIAFCVENKYIEEMKIYGKPVVALERVEEYIEKDIKLVLGIGYRNMGNVKKKIFELLKEKGYCFTNYVHPTAIISKNAVIGEGNNIMENVIIQEGVTIGNGNILFGNCLIGHESTLGDYNTVAGCACIAGCVNVRNNCFIGVNSTIKDHITISNYVLIGAATYCSESLSEYQVLVPQKSVVLEGKISTDYI